MQTMHPAFNKTACCIGHSWLLLQARLQEMQHRRQRVHKQAEAAIQEAEAQAELNASQYDRAGRSLVHIKVHTIICL